MIASYLAIFAAGVLTVLSPCVLPLAPILVGGLVAGEHASRWSRLRASLWFSVGFAVVFASLGLGLSAIVNVVQPLRSAFLVGAGILLALYGLKMMGLVDTSRRFAWMERRLDVRTAARIADLRPMLLGAIFALTWTPCAGPILGGVLTYVAARRDSVMPSVLMLLVFASGVVTPLVLIAVASEYVVPLLRRLGPHVVAIERASGAVLVALAAIVAFQPFASSRQVAASTSLVGGADIDHERHSDGAQLLVFHSEHCPACRAMEADLAAFERACRSDEWALKRIDVDRAENAKTVERFDVRALPTISVIDGQGHETTRLVGYQSEARLRDALQHEIPLACAPSAPAPDVPVEEIPACEVGRTC